MQKINCPYHRDETASMAIYPDHAYCFGCSTKVSIKELYAKIPNGKKLQPFKKQSLKVDLHKKLDNISKFCSMQTIRGFELPCDSNGYYLIYPDRSYYVYRLFKPLSNSDKYRSPTGHRKPLYKPNVSTKKELLFVVEGQLNALSLAQVTDYQVVSHGPASDLLRPDYVSYYLQFKSICLIVDKDAAGVAFAIQLKNQLLANNKRVLLMAVETDYNDIWQQGGKEALKKEEKKCLEVLGVPDVAVLSAFGG